MMDQQAFISRVTLGLLAAEAQEGGRAHRSRRLGRHAVAGTAIGLHGGDLNGFILVKGEEGKLDTVQHSDKFTDLLMRVALNVQGVGVVRGWSGESAASQVQRYANLI